MKPSILISSGDAEFYLLLSHILEVDGFAAALVDGVEETFDRAAEMQPQAIVMDCRPGSFCGADACLLLKRNPDTAMIPVVALVSPGAENQHVDLLKAGVDESFIRPFAPAKLLDFLHATLAHEMRNGFHENGNGYSLHYGDIEMSLDTYRVRCGGRAIHLGPIEFRLLRHLLRKPGQVFSRDELISAAWPENIYVEARTVDVHIGRLRKTLKSVVDADMIRTVRSAGYALAEKTLG